MTTDDHYIQLLRIIMTCLYQGWRGKADLPPAQNSPPQRFGGKQQYCTWNHKLAQFCRTGYYWCFFIVKMIASFFFPRTMYSYTAATFVLDFLVYSSVCVEVIRLELQPHSLLGQTIEVGFLFSSYQRVKSARVILRAFNSQIGMLRVH